MAESMACANNPRITVLTCALLGAVTLVVYWPVFQHNFIIYDDHQYITENPHVLSGLTWLNVKWAMTSGYASNWHPLTWISHMVDVQLFGAKPGWHHLVNVLFHIANALLLYFGLKRMTRAQWRSAFVAALFALHPLHVESVAWAAERKDVLSSFFFMFTLWAYGRYAEELRPAQSRQGDPGEHGYALETQSNSKDQQSNDTPPHSLAGTNRKRVATINYCLALGLFSLGLMSKPMVVTLPFVLLLLDYWPLGRLEFDIDRYGVGNSSVWKLFREKLPFFVLSACSCLLTVWAQKEGGAVASLQLLPLGARLENAVIAYVVYLSKMFWPADLSIIYLRPLHGWPLAAVSVGGFLLVACTALVVLLARRQRTSRFLLVGWFWFLGVSVPTIGLLQVGIQSYADRYTYLPLIGCFIMLVWGVARVFTLTPGGKRLAFLSPAVLALAAAVSRHQLQFWQNSEQLFKHSISVTKDNYMAHNILGVALSANNYAEAEANFLAALKLQPLYADALLNLGVLYTYHHEYEKGIDYIDRAVGVDPNHASTFATLAERLDRQGQAGPAVRFYREALRFAPERSDTCNNLAWILSTSCDSKLRGGTEAVGWAERACELTQYQQAVYIGTLAAAYAEAGRFQEAAATADKAIDLASATGQKELAAKNRKLRELYRQGKPYRESNPSGTK